MAADGPAGDEERPACPSDGERVISRHAHRALTGFRNMYMCMYMYSSIHRVTTGEANASLAETNFILKNEFLRNVCGQTEDDSKMISDRVPFFNSIVSYTV